MEMKCCSQCIEGPIRLLQPLPEWTTSLLRALVEVPMALSLSRTITSRPDNAKALPMARPTMPEETHLHQPLFLSVTCKGLHESSAAESHVLPAPTTTVSTGVCAAMLLFLAAMGTERDIVLKAGTELFKTESIGRRVLRSHISG